MFFYNFFLQDLPRRPCSKWVSTKCTRKSLQSFQKRHKNLSSHALRQTQSSERRQLNFWNIRSLTSKFINLFRLRRSSEQPHKPMIFVLSCCWILMIQKSKVNFCLTNCQCARIFVHTQITHILVGCNARTNTPVIAHIFSKKFPKNFF